MTAIPEQEHDMPDTVTQDEWDEARTVFYRALSDYDQLDPHIQAQIAEMSAVIHSNLEMQARRAEAERQAKDAGQRAQAAERKSQRDAMIPAWCLENLKPGMVVKVKARNAGFRRIEGLRPGIKYRTRSSPGTLTGRHMHVSRSRDHETGEVRRIWREDNYITEHTLTNVTGVVLDPENSSEVTTIMDLVEGRKSLPAQQ